VNDQRRNPDVGQNVSHVALVRELEQVGRGASLRRRALVGDEGIRSEGLMLGAKMSVSARLPTPQAERTSPTSASRASGGASSRPQAYEP
jgi:hypothetical protein